MLAIYIAVFASAAAAVLVRGFQQFRAGINIAMFMGLMKKLVDAGDSERAIKVCVTVPKSMIATICVAILRRSLEQDGALSLADVHQKARKDAIAAYTKTAQLPFMALGLALVAMSLPGAETGLSLVATLAPPVAVVLIAALEILSSRKNVRAVRHHSDEFVGLLLRRQNELSAFPSGDA